MALITSMGTGSMAIVLVKDEGVYMKKHRCTERKHTVRIIRYSPPVVMTLVTLGPIGWFFINWSSESYDKLPLVFVAALLCTILSTIFWMNAIRWDWDDDDLAEGAQED